MLWWKMCGRVCAGSNQKVEGGYEQVRLLAILKSPKRALAREWERRERELDAAFARGRRRRWERVTLNRAK
jgi:hypothetical protein